MTNNYLESTSSPLLGIESQLTLKLREEAITAGWPGHIVNNISIVVNGTDLTVSYPDQYADEIDDLEYGTPSDGPSAVLRTFVSKNNDILINQFADWSVDQIGESELFQ